MNQKSKNYFERVKKMNKKISESAEHLSNLALIIGILFICNIFFISFINEQIEKDITNNEVIPVIEIYPYSENDLDLFSGIGNNKLSSLVIVSPYDGYYLLGCVVDIRNFSYNLLISTNERIVQECNR